MPAVAVLALIAAGACGSGPAQHPAAGTSATGVAGNAGAQALGSSLADPGTAQRGSPDPSATGKAAKNASPKSTSSPSSNGGIAAKIVSGGTGAPPLSGRAVPGSPVTRSPGATGGNPAVGLGGVTPGPGSAPASPTPDCDATLPAVKSVGITNVQMGRVAANGSIQAASTFSAATDRKIVAVVSLNPQLAVTGTVIDYATIYGCTYHPSSTYTLAKPLTYFDAEFDAATTPFTPGTYHLRFFVNSVAAWDVGYTITP